MAKQTTPPIHSHSSPPRHPPKTPVSKTYEPKARTPRNKFYTYKQCLSNDSQARHSAIYAFKKTDAYIYEMDHIKRRDMLADVAAEVDARRTSTGEHVSCLFEEAEEMQETPLSPEEAAGQWEVLRAEIATKTSGLRGKARPTVRMLPKSLALEEEKGVKESVVEVKESPGDEEDEEPEVLTSKGVPLVMIDDDDDD